MKHWDRQAETLLAAACGRDEAPAAARARVKSAVASSIALSAAAGASTLVLGSASSAAAKLPVAVHAASTLLPAASVAAPSSSLAALGPVAVGVALGLSAISPSEVVPPAPVVAQSPSVPAPTRTRPRLEITRGRLLAPVATSAPSAAPSTVPEAKSPEMLPNISEEASLLEHARLVLRQGDPELTLRLLDRLRKEFPRGALFYESLATRAVALCRLGRSDEALQILARLEAIAPRSGLIAEVRRACHVPADTADVEGAP